MRSLAFCNYIVFLVSGLGCQFRFSYADVESGMEDAAEKIENYDPYSNDYPQSLPNFHFPTSYLLNFNYYGNYPNDLFKSRGSGFVFTKGNPLVFQFYFLLYVFLIILTVLFLTMLLISKNENKWRLWRGKPNYLMISFVFVLLIIGFTVTLHLLGKLPAQDQWPESLNVAIWPAKYNGLHYYGKDKVGFCAAERRS